LQNITEPALEAHSATIVVCWEANDLEEPVGLEIMGAVVIGIVAAVLLIRRFGKKNR
jgi:hypothetical protein